MYKNITVKLKEVIILAKNDTNKRPPFFKRILGLANGVQSNMDSLYTSTYYNTNRTKKDITTLKNDINASIDNLKYNNIDAVGMPNISKMYSRIFDVQHNADVVKNIEDMFSDNAMMDGVLGAYTQNKYYKELDAEIDTICKYVPKLAEALEVKKDNVLSADHFSKDFITVKNPAYDDDTFARRIREIKNVYEILDLADRVYEKTAKYGERFVYIVPYKKALQKLLQNKNGALNRASMRANEGVILQEGAQPFVMQESEFDMSKVDRDHVNFNMEINTTNVLIDEVFNMKTVHDKYKTIQEMAMNEAVKDVDIKDMKSIKKFSHTIDDDLKFDEFDDYTSQDGFINAKKGNEEKDTLIDIPGCIVKELERSAVIPIYIESICMGYYYFEFLDKTNDSFDWVNMQMQNSTNMLSRTSKYAAETDKVQQDDMIRYISAQLSRYIDSKFINTNQDLRKEIYMILKANDLLNLPNSSKFRVTFIPPEDMVHVKFNEDDNHRGISDLHAALIPAKLYACLYITNTIAVMTRGQDKRVYYVRQTVDTNIAQTLLNTIEQIKKSNFGIRQIENINHILNITGRFNDYIIPRSPSGDTPVEFDIMPKTLGDYSSNTI